VSRIEEVGVKINLDDPHPANNSNNIMATLDTGHPYMKVNKIKSMFVGFWAYIFNRGRPEGVPLRGQEDAALQSRHE
jgi:hypothetical protein